MIVFLTLIYVAFLFGMLKLGIIKMNTFWKISPVLWMLALFLVLFVPMQWGAPMGAVRVYDTVIEIVPSVSGEVIEVSVKPMQKLQKGDVLFRIDPAQYEAAVNLLDAQLKLAKANLSRAEDLMARGVGRQLDIDIYLAESESLEAQLENAHWELERTWVRAPADGHVVALSLRPGQRVSSMPIRSWVAFVEDDGRRLAVGIPQSRLRHVKIGQSAEVVTRLFPGKTISATVTNILDINRQAQLQPSGVLPDVPMASDPVLPFGVILDIDNPEIDLSLIPGGATGTAAIYTESVEATHVIRRVMMRMEAWMNYLKA
jgi:multidrug efflux pump subunit AcrA (membrane-fusion protein)